MLGGKRVTFQDCRIQWSSQHSSFFKLPKLAFLCNLNWLYILEIVANQMNLNTNFDFSRACGIKTNGTCIYL